MTDVRLVDDPGRRGRIIGDPRERTDGLVYKVRWNDGLTSWTPEYAIERLDDGEDDYFSLLENRRFGRHADLRRNLTFIQMSGRLADVIYSMDTTHTDFLPFQYKPVLTFLESPSNAILIADEVGLGKTIEAGLIWTELRARYDARRLVVVCPSMLRDKWRLELQTKFGIEAAILSAGELAKELTRGKHTLPDGRGCICSLQGLRPPSGWDTARRTNDRIKLARLLDELHEEEPVIDLLVIDEAHYLRNPNTQSAAIGRLLREVSAHVVLLSATPVNNYERDLFQLLNLVDPDSFSFPEQFANVLAANEPLVRARTLALDPASTGKQIRVQLHEARRHPLLSNSKQLHGLLAQNLDTSFLREPANRIALANRLERINLLRHTISRTRKSEVQELRVVREASSYFVELETSGAEWQFYERVTNAIRQYAGIQGIGDGFLLSSPQRQMSSCMYAAAKSWADRSFLSDLGNLMYEDLGAIDMPEGDVGPLIEHIAAEVLPGLDIESLRQHDSKFEKFRRVVKSFVDQHPDEKLIVFSYFKATLEYLEERFSELGITSQVLHGGVQENKQEAIDRFRDSDHVRVLLASEVASEGVDLQFCSVVINYDLPWNPMKIEQRIGRIDRIGQLAEKILIWNMGYANTIDDRIYSRLLTKLEIFERALGGMEVILGELMSTLSSDLLSQQLTPQQEAERIDQTYRAVENNRRQQDELEASAAHLIAHGGYILERIRSAHEFKRGITDLDLKAYVHDYLTRFAKGSEFLVDDRDPLIVSIRLPAVLATQLDRFIQKSRLHNQTKLASTDRVRCRFHNKIGRVGSKPEVIGQLHPLVRFISSDLRDRAEGFFPLVAVTVSRSAVPGLQARTYAFVSRCWMFTGLRTEEELRARAKALDGEPVLLDADQSWDLVNAAKVQGKDWLAVVSEVSVDQLKEVFDECDIRLEEDYDSAKQERENENSDRVTLQTETVKNHCNRLVKNQKILLQRYRAEGRERLIRMTQGRINAITRKYDLHLERLRQQGDMNSHTKDVCYGVVRVTK